MPLSYFLPGFVLNSQYKVTFPTHLQWKLSMEKSLKYKLNTDGFLKNVQLLVPLGMRILDAQTKEFLHRDGHL